MAETFTPEFLVEAEEAYVDLQAAIGPLHAQIEKLEAERDDARTDERARIVAWLRERPSVARVGCGSEEWATVYEAALRVSVTTYCAVTGDPEFPETEED